jgi:hypothetical protein
MFFAVEVLVDKPLLALLFSRAACFRRAFSGTLGGFDP